MKIYEKKIINTKCLKGTECDKCLTFEYENTFDQSECQVIIKTGDIFPEGGTIHEYTIDLCQTCGEELFAKLKKDGYRINYREIDM